MAPATATQDEDLLIISEDTTENTNDIDFSFSFGDDTPVSTPAASVVSEVTSSVEEPVITTTSVQAETSSSLGDFSFDVFWQNESASASPVQDETSLEIVSETPEILDTVTDSTPEITLWETSLQDTLSNPLSVETQSAEVAEISPVIQEEMIVPSAAIISEVPQAPAQEVSGTESLNDILAATIAKLTLRAEIISTDSSGKSTQIASIQAQIKALEEQVSALEGEISLLSSESEKISKNIEALEEMKLDPVKEHNARRAVKK